MPSANVGGILELGARSISSVKTTCGMVEDAAEK
jgi:hypothetical protein